MRKLPICTRPTRHSCANATKSAGCIFTILLYSFNALYAQQPAPTPPQGPVNAKSQPAAAQTQSPARTQPEAERRVAAAQQPQPQPQDLSADQLAKIEKAIAAFMA